jgi:hypothetical protein
LLEIFRRHAALALQVEKYAGIDRPAARTHHHPIEWREPHGGIDAAAVAHRAEAGAAAEMGNDNPFAGEIRRDFLQSSRNEFIT